MTKEQALNLLQLLSAIESYCYKEKSPFLPGTLSDGLQNSMSDLRNIILDKSEAKVNLERVSKCPPLDPLTKTPDSH